jgi:hypothetical protein
VAVSPIKGKDPPDAFENIHFYRVRTSHAACNGPSTTGLPQYLLEIFQGTDCDSTSQRFGPQNTNATVNDATQELITRYRRSTTQTSVSPTYLWSNDLSAGMSNAATFNGISVTITEEVVESGPGYEIVEVTLSVTAGSPTLLFLTLDLQPTY